MDQKVCKHVSEVTELKQAALYECAECVKTGSDWVHLRTCQTCGQTLCCDNSPRKHMTKHYHRSGHPVMISAEPGERWMWCFIDKQIVEF